MHVFVSESAATLQLQPQVAIPAPSPRPDVDSAFATVLKGVGAELQRGEAVMRAAVTGLSGDEDLSAGRLLALQTGVYRYSEAIDLASRLIDRASSGIKTLLQGSGQ